jgi:hypothetical protein
MHRSKSRSTALLFGVVLCSPLRLQAAEPSRSAVPALIAPAAQHSSVTKNHAPHKGYSGPGANSFVSGGNDNCATATQISGTGKFQGDTIGATTDGPPDCGMSADVWYHWIIPIGGEYTISLCSGCAGTGTADFDTVLAVYDGVACPGNLIVCNDDFCGPSGLQSQVTFSVPGGVYLIRVGGVAGATGHYVMSIQMSPGVVNGNFESGDFSGWTLEYGTVQRVGTCVSTVAWGSTLPMGHPVPTIIDSNTPMVMGQTIDVDPYCGTYMARINDLQGGNHATRMRQTFTITDDQACPPPNAQHVNVTWGAMLQDGGHCQGRNIDTQAYFSLEILVDSTSVSLTKIDATAASQSGSGWTQGPTNTWYKTSTSSIPFYASPNSTVEVILSAYDCSGGAHGGMAFLDCINFCCEPTCGPDPIANYRFDDNTNIGLDLSGNGHQGILGAATIVDADCGDALNFQPNNNVDEFTIPHANNLDITGPMTGMALIRPHGTQSPDGNPSCPEGTIFSKGGNYWFQVGHNNGTLEFQNEGSGSSMAIVNIGLCLNKWTHVAFVRAADNTISFFKNGVRLGPASLALLPATSNNNKIMVGNYGFGDDPGACEFNGDIDEIQLFDRALSDMEIMDVFLCGCPVDSCTPGTVDPHCFGDGSLAPCPCGNNGLPGSGCGNSDHPGGANLSATGAPSLGADTLQLVSSGHHSSSLAIFVQGAPTGGAFAYGDGLRCIGSPLKRVFKMAPASTPTLVAPSVASSPPTPATISSQSAALGDSLLPGTIREYQMFYRDPVNFCTPASFNVTNGMRVVWAP